MTLWMTKVSRWILPRPLLGGVGRFFVNSSRELDFRELEEAIGKALPVGTPKRTVIDLIRARGPIFCDDLGPSVETRLFGQARDGVRYWDIELTFEFDAEGQLKSYSKTACLLFF